MEFFNVSFSLFTVKYEKYQLVTYTHSVVVLYNIVENSERFGYAGVLLLPGTKPPYDL